MRFGRSRSRCSGRAFPRAPGNTPVPPGCSAAPCPAGGASALPALGTGGGGRGALPGRDPRTGTSREPPGPLPSPLTAAPFPGSAAAIPPRPPRRARARERRWAPCAGVSPGPRCCRRLAAGWRRRPAPPSPRLPGWCSLSRRAARAAAMSPSPPGKGRTGQRGGDAPVAPGTGYRAGHGCRGRSRVQHRRPDSGTGAEHPVGWGQTPSVTGAAVPAPGCPCHPVTLLSPTATATPSLSPSSPLFPIPVLTLLTPSLSPSRGPARATRGLAWPCPR